MKINFENMLHVPETRIQITTEDIKLVAPKIKEQLLKLNRGEGDNKDNGVPMIGWQDFANKMKAAEINLIKVKAKALAEKCEVIFVIGIGGSYLGPRAVIEAMYGRNYNEVIFPKIYFLGCDTDPDYYQHCLELAKHRSIGAIVISKSGTTTEPGIAFRFIKKLMDEKYGSRGAERIIAVTDARKGALRQVADAEGYQTFVIPDDIGGRFSVITPVGLVPIAAAGIDIAEYIEGYKDLKHYIDSPELSENPAALLAALRFLAWKKGAQVEYQVTNSTAFEANIFWTMQLEPESEGHNGHGLHVVPALFPRDLHSIGQIIQQGPRNLIEIATKVLKTKNDLAIPEFKDDADGLNYLAKNNLTLSEINNMTIDGPLAAHYSDGVPNLTIEVDEITPYNLGKYHFMLMKATALMGYLQGHNPFIQPGVQFWKDKLFSMAGKPGYEKQHQEYLTLQKNKKEIAAISF